MSKGAKIAIGCFVAVLIAGGVTVAAIVGVGFWAKGKAVEYSEKFTGNEKQIEELQKKADSMPFTRPADGLLKEERLVTFLDVRKDVYAVYEKHKDTIEAMQKKKQGSFDDVTTGLGILNDLRLARAQALASHGMSQDEYRYLVEQIYKTMWAADIARQNGGKSVSETAGAAYDKAAEEVRKAADAGKGTSETDEAARKSAAELQRQAEELREKAKELDAPPQNIALYQKHEADIKKYAMSGLELLGL